MSFTVTFDLDSKATRTGGGALTQTVASGGTAVAPTISVLPGFIFTAWDTALTPITADTTITATYNADTNILNICDAIAKKVQANAALVAYCAAKFTKQPYFFVGMDSNSLPPEAQMPYIAIVPGASQNIADAHGEHNILVGVVCQDATQTTAANVLANKLMRFDGYGTMSDFEKLVFQAIEAYMNPASDLSYYSLLGWTQVQYKCYFPEYHATREITVATQL